jgi:hypothetical protein
VRSTLGPILLHVAILIAGMGLLRAAKIVPRLFTMRALAAGGLAYLCGLSAALTLSILLLVVGGPFNLVTFGLICAILASPLLLEVPALASARPRRPDWLARPRAYWHEAGLERRLAIVSMAAFGLIAVVGLLTLSGVPIDREAGYDTWNLWMRKANLMFFGSHLPLAVLKSRAEGYIQAYYPLGYPLLLAAHMRAVGVYETATVHVVVWILLVAFVWAGAFLASQVTRTLVWAGLLPGVVFLAYGQASSGYADIPVAIFLAIATLATGIWLERGGRGNLAVACLLIAGSCQIKNEGLTGAGVIVLAAGLYLLGSRRMADLRDLVAGTVAVVLVAVFPWRLWLHDHLIPSDHSLGKTFDPGYLIDHFSRVWPSLKALEAEVVSQKATAVFIAIALALALVRLRGRAREPVAAFYLGVGLLYFLGLLAAYWTSPFSGESGLSFYIQTSVFRIVPGGLAFICVAAILHLSGIKHDAGQQAPSDSSRASPAPPPPS